MPGFWGEQAWRIIRENWGDNAQALAEELYALAGLQGPMQSDRPLQLTQTDPNQPAIQIIDKTGVPGGANTIQVVRTNPDGTTQTNNCNCGGGGGTGGGGGGSGGATPPNDNNGGGGGGPNSTNPITIIPGPGREFFARISITIHGGSFDGTIHNVVSQLECKAYNPPTIPAPQTFFAFQTGLAALADTLAACSPFSSYSIVDGTDEVFGPGDDCQAGT